MRGNCSAFLAASMLAAVHASAAGAPDDRSAAANSQPLPEVAVVGKMDARTLDHVVRQFVQSHAKPSAMIGQVGRWREAVCPAVSGLRDSYGDFVSHRITSVAHEVGAPTPAAGKKCNVNAEVVFTASPQQLLDHIADKYHPLLGYYRLSERKQVITFSGPIQAWYMTGTRSLDYQPPITGLDKMQTTGDMAVNPSAAPPFVTGLQADSNQSAGGPGSFGSTGAAGSYFTKGLRSEFMHVLIIVDSNAVKKYPLGGISDYVAMLALTRLASADTCSDLPSIINLLASGCAAAPATLTTADIAYLKALYGADLDQNLNIEQGDMHERMLSTISKQ